MHVVNPFHNSFADSHQQAFNTTAEKAPYKFNSPVADMNNSWIEEGLSDRTGDAQLADSLTERNPYFYDFTTQVVIPPASTLPSPFFCGHCPYDDFIPSFDRETFHADEHTVFEVQKKTTEPYACTSCKKDFKHKRHLARHMLSATHSITMKSLGIPCLETPPKLPCPFCSRKFNRSDNLKSHARKCTQNTNKRVVQEKPTGKSRIIAKNKPYACTLCKKGFVGKKHLARHNLSATHINTMENLGIPCLDPPPKLPCPFCSREFNRSDNLKSHASICTQNSNMHQGPRH